MQSRPSHTGRILVDGRYELSLGLELVPAGVFNSV